MSPRAEKAGLRPDHPRCRMCNRALTTREARRRGYGPICWPKWLAQMNGAEPGDPQKVQTAITQPLFPEEP